jgi:uncharacterized protein (TIGR02996 family)
MTDDELLRATIVARPDDDLPRLVYADFLEEAGHDARAELIRVQCELERRPTAELRRREAELLAHATEWRVPGLTGPQTFKRGMIESVETTAAALVRLAPGALALHPVRHLRLVNADRWTAELARLDIWRGVESLTLNNNNLGVGDRLQLFDAADMPALKTLSLRNNRLWPEAVAALAETRVAPQLRRLDLSGNPVMDEGVATIARHPAFTGLTELIVRSDELSQYECVTVAGARSVAHSWTLSSLTALNFEAHYLGDTGLMELVESSNADRLVDLDLSFNDIGEAGPQSIVVLVRSRHLGRLRRLNLAGNGFSTLALEELANWPRAALMESIDLRDADLGRQGREILEASPHAAKFLFDPQPPEFV